MEPEQRTVMPTAKDLTKTEWERIWDSIEGGFTSGYVEVWFGDDFVGVNWSLTEKGIVINIMED